MYEVMFCNMLVFKSIICQTGVTKGLELAFEIIKAAEHRWPELLSTFTKLGLPLALKLTVMSQSCHIYYNICKLLICYLLNKIELDYSISQVRTKKQLHQENYLLASEMNRWLNSPQVNKLGPAFDPLVVVLNKKYIQEAVQASSRYRQTELAHLTDEALLNMSLSTITDRHDRVDVHGDIVKDSIKAKAGINAQ